MITRVQHVTLVEVNVAWAATQLLHVISTHRSVNLLVDQRNFARQGHILAQVCYNARRIMYEQPLDVSTRNMREVLRVWSDVSIHLITRSVPKGFRESNLHHEFYGREVNLRMKMHV